MEILTKQFMEFMIKCISSILKLEGFFAKHYHKINDLPKILIKTEMIDILSLLEKCAVLFQHFFFISKPFKFSDATFVSLPLLLVMPNTTCVGFSTFQLSILMKLQDSFIIY